MNIIEKKKYKSVKWLFKSARPICWQIVFLTLCAMLVSYISVRFALASKALLDVAMGHGDSSTLTDKLISLGLLVIIQLLVQIAYTMVHLHTETAFKQKIQRNLYSKLLHKKWTVFSEYHSGELLNRMNGDAGVVTSGIMSVVPNAFAFVSKIVLSFSALYMLDSDFALILIIVGPLVLIVARLYSRAIKPLHKKTLESQGRTHSFILETLRNISVVKSFNVFERVTSIVKGLQKNTLRLTMKRGYLSIFANILFYISLTIGYYFAVGWCAVKISRGIMTVGTFTAIIQLVGQVQTPFKDMAALIPQVFAMTASAERIMELEQLPDEKCAYPDFDANAVYDSMVSISAEGLCFSYDKEKIFDLADVVIDKNSLTAISGISGIGKSTFMKILLGLLEPDDGFVRINCRDGESSEVDASARKLFAYVPQGNMILSGTVRENICFMSEDVSDNEIQTAVRIACLNDVIDDLPDGLDTKLGEGGAGLSEGQIQRLAVARAICSGAPVLLLDEATSALDEETERRLLENIIAMKNRTCIIISHKECALALSDSMLTLCDGKIKKSVYAK